MDLCDRTSRIGITQDRGSGIEKFSIVAGWPEVCGKTKVQPAKQTIARDRGEDENLRASPINAYRSCLHTIGVGAPLLRIGVHVSGCRRQERAGQNIGMV